MARGTLASNREKRQWITQKEHKHTIQHSKFKQLKNEKQQNTKHHEQHS
jgi:hypothetical protein